MQKIMIHFKSTLIFQQFQKYAEISTFIGVKYFARTDFCIAERLFWVLITFTFMGFASTVAGILWSKFREKPIEILIENTNFPLAEFPFPSVTICPTNNINVDKAKLYLSRFMNGTDEKTNSTLYDVISALYLLKYPNYIEMRPYLKSSKKYLKQFDAMNITDFMLTVLPRCDEIMEKCFWHGKVELCCDMFTIQPTEEGFCYSFNDFTSAENQKCPIYDLTSHNFDREGRVTCHPRFLTFSGAFSGLTIFTKPITPPEYFLRNNQSFYPGLTVMVSTAYEYPEAGSGNLLQTLPGEALQLEVKPVMLQSDEKLSRIAKDDRLCMLKAESNVLLTEYYSQSSCYLTCRHNFIIQMCGCQLYFFYEPSRQVPLCKVSQLICIVKYAYTLQLKTPSKFSFTKPNIKDYPDCECQTGCEGTWYDLAVRTSNMTSLLGYNVTGLIDIYYARYGAIKYKRQLAFTSEDLIEPLYVTPLYFSVSLGGVANLFLGSSFISVSEVLYYFTRSVCIIIYHQIAKFANVNQQKNVSQQNIPHPRAVIFGPMPSVIHDSSRKRNKESIKNRHQSLDKTHVKQYKKLRSYNILKEFTQASTIHGVQHIFKEGETSLHRVIWVVFFSLSFSGAAYLIYDSWIGYMTVPIAITVSDTHFPVDGIYFPAVTVCPIKKIVKHQALKYLTEKLGDWVAEEPGTLAFLNALSHLKHPLYHDMEPYLNTMNEDVLAKFDPINITDLMLKCLPSCQEIFIACYWQGLPQNCCAVFSYQRSEEGFCYSVNSFTSEANKNCIYEDVNITGSNCALLSTPNTGPRSGIELLLKGPQEAAVSVHHPNEFPEAGKWSIIPIGDLDKLNFGILPTITKSTNDIRHLSLDVAGCYFKDSYYSAITNSYSQKTCLIECRMKFLFKQCGCLPYFITLRRIPAICSASQLRCIAEHEEELRFYRTPNDIPNEDEDKIKSYLDCTHCLPTCSERQYDLVIEMTKDTLPRKWKFNAVVDVYYRTPGALVYTRSMTYDYVQLVVNLGGIGGLFLGGSVLSLVEATYWLLKALTTLFCPISKNKINASKSTHAKNVFITDQAWLN